MLHTATSSPCVVDNGFTFFQISTPDGLVTTHLRRSPWKLEQLRQVTTGIVTSLTSSWSSLIISISLIKVVVYEVPNKGRQGCP